MKKLILLLAILVLPFSASAQLLIDPVSKAAAGTNDLGVTFGFSEVDYEIDSGGTATVDRKYTGMSLAHGLSEDVDLYGALAYTYEAEVNDSNSDDDGMIMAAGVKSRLGQVEELSFYGYGQFQYLAEDYGNDVDASLFETNLGVLSRVNLFDPLAFYAGLDFIPISEGELDTRVGDVDFERDDIFGVRLGADLEMDGWSIRAEYALVSEQTVTLGLNFNL